jgi:hypothetical protein
MSETEKTMEEIAAYPIFNGQAVQFPKKIEGDYTLTVVTDPQKYNFMHFDETGQHSKVTIRPVEGDKKHQVFIPSESDTFPHWDIKHDSNQQFWTIKPKTESMTFNLDYGNKTVPLTLPQVFFQSNEPMQIISSFWNIDQGKDSADHNKQFIMPAMSTTEFKKDDTYVIAEIKSDIVKREQLKEGENELEEKSEEFHEFLVKSLLANTGGGIGQIVDNLRLLIEFFPLKKFYIKKIKENYCIVFKGYAGTRKTINGVKYSIKNPKIISLSIVQKGKNLQNAFSATAAPFKEVVETGELSALKGTLVGLVLIGAVDYAYWYNEGILSENGRYLSDLLIEIGSDFVKGLIGSVIAGALVGFFLSFVTIALPVVVVIGTTIVVGVIVGVVTDRIDNNIGATKAVQRAARTLSDKVSDFYAELENQIIAAYFNMAGMNFPKIP